MILYGIYMLISYFTDLFGFSLSWTDHSLRELIEFGGADIFHLGAFFWPVIGGLYWKKGNSTACLSSTILGLVTFIFFNRVKILPFGIHEIIAGLIVSGIAYFAAGMLTAKEPDEEMIRKCF